MKIALYIEDGLEQVVLTPETATEKAILTKLHDDNRRFEIKRGSFYECRAGFVRYRDDGPRMSSHQVLSQQDDCSTMIVLRPIPNENAPTSG